MLKLTRGRVTAGLTGLVLAGGLAIGGAAVAAAATPGPTPPAANSTSAPCPHAVDAGESGGMFGQMHARQAMAGGDNSPIAGAAEYLGLSRGELREQLQAGTSLADVATAQGKSVAGLEDAMVSAMQTRMDANTTMTDEQRAEALARAQERITERVTTAHHPGAGHGFAGHGAMGPHGGPMDR